MEAHLETESLTSYRTRAFYALALDFTNARVFAGGDFTGVLNNAYGYFVGLTNPDDSALPVQLTAFTVRVDGLNAELRWRTESEVENYGFEVERRMMEDGKWKMENRDHSPFTVGKGGICSRLRNIFITQGLLFR